MSTHTGESARRYKLRVNFVGIDAYESDGDALPFRKLIYLASATDRVGDVRQGIKALFTKLYPEDGQHAVILLRDSYMCDVADDYLVSEVFDESPVVYAAMPGLTIPLETAGTSLNDPLLSPNESIISGRHDSGYRSKRRRYTFSSLRITDSPSFSAQNTPPARSPQSQCRGAYDLNGQGTRPKTLNSNDSGLSHISPELMPYFKSTMAQNTSGERTNNVMQTTPSSEAWARIGSQEHSSPALTCLPMQPSSPNMDCDMDSVPQRRPPTSLEQATSTAIAPAAKSLELAHSVAPQTASAGTTVTSTPVVPAATIAAATAPTDSESEDETESDSSDEESDSAALNSIRALAGKPAEAKGNAVAKPPVAKVASARPPPAGKGATKVDDPSAKPSVVPKRKIQLKTKIAAGSSSDSSDDLDSDIASDSGPKQRPKPPALSLPTANRRSSGLIDLVKSQKSALGRESPGIMSISQMASAKPYDDIRKTMARFAAARVSQSIPPTPTTAMPQTPHTAGIAPKQASSESDSSSDSDSDSSSDDDEDVTLEVKPSLKETPAPVKRNRAIRFAGVNTPSASAKARRRKSTLLNL
ncbi:hypothetical protein GGI01_002790 [Coemansia sp. RSA 376]|nr:hypothetical protein GGI01_002790 [Coemansia sp. RSA 376]